MRNVLFNLFLLLAMNGQAQTTDTLPNFDNLWNYSDPAGTAVVFKEILPKAEEANNPVYLGQLITQIGRTYSLQGNFEEAHSWLSKLEKWDLNKYPLVQCRYFLELGRAYNSAGDKGKARVAFQKAWYIASNKGFDYHAVDAAHMQAIAAEPEMQANWAEAAISFAELSKDKDARGWLGPLYNNLGWTYMDLKEYPKALESFQKGLDYRLANSTNEQGIFIARWAVARAHRALKNYKKALEIQQALEKEILTKSLDPDGYVYEELAELYLETGQKDLAKSYFGLAYNLLSQDKWLMDNEPDRMSRMRTLATDQ